MSSSSSKKKNFYFTSLGLEILEICNDSSNLDFDRILQDRFGKL